MIALAALALLSPLFGPLCSPCHGPEGRGDGPAAALYANRPADLGQPHGLKLGGDPASLARTIRFGLPGTGMPAFGALSDAQIHALVAHVGALATDTPRPPIVQDAYWPNEGIHALGPPTPGRPPALSRVDADGCARCHPAIAAEWRSSVHARAMGPGVVGQYHARPMIRPGCDRCHAPLVEQRQDAALAGEGVTCAACHLRAGRKQAGPLALRARKPAHGAAAERMDRLGRSDVCLPCHTLPRAAAVDGSPLLDTWREWAASPYLPAGIQCQHCHMPGGDHRMRGVHDPETVRQAVRLEVSPRRVGTHLRTQIRLTNVGAGHHFPTTATPRAVLRARLLGPEGPLAETETLWAIGRTVRFSQGAWQTVGDTRVPAGATRRWCHEVALPPEATAVEVSLHMFPDWYYATVYRSALSGPLSAAALPDYAAALASAEGSAFLVAFTRHPLNAVAAPPSAPPGAPASVAPSSRAAGR